MAIFLLPLKQKPSLGTSRWLISDIILSFRILVFVMAIWHCWGLYEQSKRSLNSPPLNFPQTAQLPTYIRILYCTWWKRFWSGYVPIQPSVRPCATNPWYIWMPLLNSNKPYQFHIEARPTNSYAYFCEPIRTCPFFYQESSWSAILLFLSEDSLVVLRSCPYLCGGTDLPQHGADLKAHYLIKLYISKSIIYTEEIL